MARQKTTQNLSVSKAESNISSAVISREMRKGAPTLIRKLWWWQLVAHFVAVDAYKIDVIMYLGELEWI